MNLDNKTGRELMKEYEESGQTVLINDGHTEKELIEAATSISSSN